MGSTSLFAQATVGPELVTNGTFPTENNFSVDDWMISGTASGTRAAVCENNGSMFFNRGGSGVDGTGSQDITTEVGVTYQITFDYGSSGTGGVPQIRFRVYDTGTGIGTPFEDETINANPGGSRTYFFDATGTSTTINFTDASTGNMSSRDAFIDNVSVKKLVTPGGVATDLHFWLNASAGTSTTVEGAFVETWTGQSPNAFVAEKDAGETDGASFISDAMNFNPVLRFEQAVGNGLSITTELFTTSGYDVEAFYVVNNNADGAASPILMNGSGNTNRFYLQSNHARFGSTSNTTLSTQPEQYLVSARHEMASSSAISSINSGIEQTRTNSNWTNYNPNGWRVGRQAQGASNARLYDGDIAEIIIYDGLRSLTERTQIQTYLAIKYGITLGGGALAYKASTGADVWTVDATYNSDIFGIANDSGSGLDQISQYRSNCNPFYGYGFYRS